MAHAQKPDFVFQRYGRIHLNRQGSQFSRLLAVEECGSAGGPWIDHVPRYSARVVATLSNHLFPLHFPSHTSPCAITFRTPLQKRKHSCFHGYSGYATCYYITLYVQSSSSSKCIFCQILCYKNSVRFTHLHHPIHMQDPLQLP